MRDALLEHFAWQVAILENGRGASEIRNSFGNPVARIRKANGARRQASAGSNCNSPAGVCARLTQTVGERWAYRRKDLNAESCGAES